MLIDLLDGEDEDDSSCSSSTYSSASFSCFSIDSTSTKSLHLSTYVSCVKSSLKWRSILLKKKEKTICPELTEEDLAFLVKNTNFSEGNIKEWFREFIMDCPEGILTKVKVMEMLTFILPRDNGKIIADLIFSTFDKDKNGWIDFNEFIIATHCTATSSPEDKLHWVFQMYDKDGSNSIQLSEMVELFGTLYLNEGLEEDLATERAEKIFSLLDINNDGDITEDEFVKGCLQDEELVELLSDKSSEPPLVVTSSDDNTPRGMVAIN